MVVITERLAGNVDTLGLTIRHLHKIDTGADWIDSSKVVLDGGAHTFYRDIPWHATWRRNVHLILPTWQRVEEIDIHRRQADICAIAAGPRAPLTLTGEHGRQ
ncbi:hypothetical protein IE4771_PE00101 (plasmid) [Rhizobium etli bv. mimosae str. IE4771]|uniref:Uncharacterized protein n=1 Tax=Rhizobium etli bv. mimosae str. IE4771 TaxID=1432050 RepID=A0A060IC51_RHIET|nr:hypothetical protein [Rhizobium sp. IE4771]AIC31327.1 hypothetical protein IE4771_PE00101 [Rhizobium sp. IE4771]